MLLFVPLCPRRFITPWARLIRQKKILERLTVVVNYATKVYEIFRDLNVLTTRINTRCSFIKQAFKHLSWPGWPQNRLLLVQSRKPSPTWPRAALIHKLPFNTHFLWRKRSAAASISGVTPLLHNTPSRLQNYHKSLSSLLITPTITPLSQGILLRRWVPRPCAAIPVRALRMASAVECLSIVHDLNRGSRKGKMFVSDTYTSEGIKK